jgi:hypothetical protein
MSDAGRGDSPTSERAQAADSTALRAHERIAQQHPAEWLVRTEAIAATWDVDTIVAVIRTDFERAVTDATTAVT